jgi:hypothetical protein
LPVIFAIDAVAMFGMTMASCSATSTCCPSPVRSRARSANATPAAASMLP